MDGHDSRNYHCCGVSPDAYAQEGGHMQNHTILVVDDEKMIRDSVSSFLRSKGLTVFSAETGTDAIRMLGREKISLIVLDLMLPDTTGEELCAKIRRTSSVPIIMLTAKSMEEDLLNGLSIGADDYMTKPFSLKELYARIVSVLRRSGEASFVETGAISFNNGGLVIHISERTVTKNKKLVELTPIEWNILVAFCKNPERTFTRENLLDLAFGDDFDGLDRVIDTHIKNLRKKIEDDPKNPTYILTVHGVGYRFGGGR